MAWVSSDLYAALDANFSILDVYEVWQWYSFAQFVNDNQEQPEFVEKSFEEEPDYDKRRKPKNACKEGLFTAYIQAFFKVKAESSGWPENVREAPSDEVKEALKQQYLEAVKLHDHVELDPSKLDTKNKGARMCAKLSMV